MNAQRSVVRSVLLLIALAAATAPAFGQTAPAGGPAPAASIPDFSGIWAHPYLFPSFETPLSGHGPLANKHRRKQVCDIDGRPMPPADTLLVGDNNMLAADHTDPILKPHAAEAVRKH